MPGTGRGGGGLPAAGGAGGGLLPSTSIKILYLGIVLVAQWHVYSMYLEIT